MRKPPRPLVVTVLVPFLTGCMGTLAQPVPEPAARSDLSVRGVVVGESADDGERVEFSRVDDVAWTDSTIAIVGVLDESGGDGQVVTRVHRLSEVAAVLVRQVDANKMSILIGSLVLGGVALATLLFTGGTTDDTVF